MRFRLTPTAGLFVVTLLWGGNFTATKLAFTQIDPLAFTAIRFAFASLLLWAILRYLEPSATLPRRALGPLTVLGVLGNTVYQLCFVEGLARMSATKSALMLAGMPAVVTLTAWALRLEAVTRRQRYAVAVATVGVVLVIFARGGEVDAAVGVGELLLIGGILTWAGYTLLLKYYQLPLSPLRLTAWTMYTGTPGLLVAGVPALLRTDWQRVSFAAYGGILYSALLSLVAAYILWNRAVAALGPSRAALYNTLTPLVAAIIAMIALHERPGVQHIVGGALIASGIVLSAARQTGDGKRETANGKRETANGKRETANGKLEMANGKPDMANGKPDMANGKRETGDRERPG